MSTRKKEQAQQPSTKFDVLKWILVAIIIFGGIVANCYYSEVAWSLRSAAGIILLGVAFVLAFQTGKGRLVWTFVLGARTELRKVVWPTRQEALQTTLLVVVMVAITAIILWGVDTLFLWLVSWLTGQRGL